MQQYHIGPKRESVKVAKQNPWAILWTNLLLGDVKATA
jgi:hypothetical protein